MEFVDQDVDATGGKRLYFECPRLFEAAQEQYTRPDLFSTKPDWNDTALDLFTDSVADVVALNRDSDIFDGPLLGAIAKLKSLFDRDVLGIELPYRGSGAVTVITPSVVTAAAAFRTNTPHSSRTIVVGRLDGLEQSTATLGLLLDDGQKIRGTLTSGAAAELTPMFGDRVRVTGTAVYRPSGRLLRIDVDTVVRDPNANGFFSQIPQPIRSRLDLRERLKRDAPKRRIEGFIGGWPGNETDEEIAAALRDLG